MVSGRAAAMVVRVVRRRGRRSIPVDGVARLDG
jgi:hypothetical protein